MATHCCANEAMVVSGHELVIIWAHPYCPWHSRSQFKNYRQKSWLPAWNPILRRLFLKLKSSGPCSFLVCLVALQFTGLFVYRAKQWLAACRICLHSNCGLLASPWAGPMVWRFCIELLKKKSTFFLFSSQFLKHFDILVVPRYGENNIFILWHCICQIM